MATLTISLNGSNVVPNSSKSYTVNDTDVQSVLIWANTVFGVLSSNNQAILLAWVQSWINDTKVQVQAFNTPAPSPPPVVNIA